MFGRNRKRNSGDSNPASAATEHLSSLVGIDQQKAALLAHAVRQRSYPRGVVTQVPQDEVGYLVAGALRIIDSDGNVHKLSADQPAAHYPLPCSGGMSQIEATVQSTLLWLPRVMLSDTTPTTPTPPKLSAPAAAALDDLRELLSSPRFELPSLPDLAIKIGAAIDRDNTTSEDIARLIQLDPVLSTRILSVVNSAAFSGVGRVGSIQQATTRLGRKKVRSLVFSCLLKSIFKIPSGELQRRMSEVWQHSAQVAALSYVLGGLTPGIDAEQALLAGLVHDIGSVAVMGGIARFPALIKDDATFDYVLASLRIDSATRVISHWGLEQELGAVVRECHNWTRIGSALIDNTDIVILARLHAAFGTRHARDLPPVDRLPAFQKLADGEMTPRHSLAVLERADADVRAVQDLISS
ncbi:MAG: HDOD domain-containing protein [Gammaproteobacteria bacterium]|nr:HDOD domain-containing protein [Gammaproteobacteria bacterium]